MEEKTITADQVTKKQFSNESTLGAAYSDAQDDNRLQKMIATKQPMSYVVYKPTLGKDNSWHTITNNQDKNDCDPKIEITQANNKLTVKASKK